MNCLQLSMHFFYPIQQCAQLVYIAAFSGPPDAWGLLLRTIDTRPRQLTCIETSVQRIIAACEDIVGIYDAITGVLQQSLHTPETVTKIQVSPDGSTLFFAHFSSVTMWDVQKGGLIHTFTTQSKINDIAVSTSHIACGSHDGSVAFWNIHTKEEGKGFGNNQPVVKTYWLSPQELVVVTESTLYIHHIIVGETLDWLSIPGHVWGMVYLEDKNEFLVGTSKPSSMVDQEECSFIRCQQHQLRHQEPEPFRWRFINLGQSQVYHGQLSSPTLVGKEIVCITPANGVQLFNVSSGNWTNNPPLLGATASVAVSLNRNLVVQANNSIQIFSVDVLMSGEAHNGIPSSHIYPLGKTLIICILQPTRNLILLEVATMQELCPDLYASTLKPLPMNQSVTAHGSFSRGLVAEFGISVIVEAWRLGTPLLGLAGAADEDALLCRWSPECTWIATVCGSPQQELHIKDVRDGTIVANLSLQDDDFGMGEVYDLTFNSETRFYLKTDGPGWHVKIPHDIIATPSGSYSHTITRGEPVPLLEPRATPPYTLDVNYEWVIDAKSRKVCWISPGNVRRGNGGHFWIGLSLIMVGDDGIVRKLSFKEPDSVESQGGTEGGNHLALVSDISRPTTAMSSNPHLSLETRESLDRSHVLPPSTTVCTTPGSSILIDLEVSACGRLISRAFPPHELIPLIEEIFTRKDEVKIISRLGGDAAQTFIDVIHEVRPTVLHLCGAA